MRSFIATVFTASLVVTQAQAMSETVTSFKGLHDILMSGKAATVYVEPALCQPKQQAADEGKPAQVITGALIQGFMERSATEIRFADNHLTIGPKGTAILEIVQYRVTTAEEGFVKVTTLSPQTYESIGPARELQCKLGKGMEFRLQG